MKRLLSLLLAVAALFLLAIPAMAAVNPPDATDSTSSYVSLSISGSGYAAISFSCNGESNVTRIHGSIYLEKKTASGWVNVYPDGATMDWQYDATGRTLSDTCFYQITEHGQYRATAVFNVHYTGGGLDIVTSYSGIRTY